MRSQVAALAGAALGLLGLVDCQDGTPLADMVDKQLHINDYGFTISLRGAAPPGPAPERDLPL